MGERAEAVGGHCYNYEPTGTGEPVWRFDYLLNYEEYYGGWIVRPIRVLLAEDHHLVREGLRALLEELGRL